MDRHLRPVEQVPASVRLGEADSAGVVEQQVARRITRLPTSKSHSYLRRMASLPRLAVLATVAITAVFTTTAAAQAPLSGVEQARRDSIRRPYTNGDIEFMSGMIAH